MINFKIILPGEVPVKKNTMNTLWFKKDKNGISRALDKPIKYYTKTYKNWVKQVAPMLEDWKIKNSDNFDFPLKGEYVVSFVMFRKHRGIVDLSALYEALQDLLIGKIGDTLDRVRVIGGRKKKVPYNPERIKILADDNVTIIRNHGASGIFYTDKPYVAIFISEFKIENFGTMLRLLHPGLELNQVEIDAVQEREQINLFGTEEGAWLKFLEEGEI